MARDTTFPADDSRPKTLVANKSKYCTAYISPILSFVSAGINVLRLE
jgi:hypothetical protein